MAYNTYDQHFEGGLGSPQSTTKYNWTGPNPHNVNAGSVDWGDYGAQNAQHKRQMIGDYMGSGQLPPIQGGGNTGVTTGAGGGGGGQFQTPEDISGHMSQYGAGLLDPNSPMSQRWMEEMREQIGNQTDAAQRAAGYQAAQSGFGAGQSPELMQMQSDLGVQGLEAAGDATNDFMLRAPEMGLGAMGTALGAETSMRGQDLASETAQAELEAQQQMFERNLEMAQREMDAQRLYQDQQLALQQPYQPSQQNYQRSLANMYRAPGMGHSLGVRR